MPSGLRKLEEIRAKRALDPKMVRVWKKEFNENAHMVFMQQ